MSDISNQLNGLLQNDPIIHEKKFPITTSGTKVARRDASIRTESLCAPMVKVQEKGDRIWYVLIAVNLKLAFPDGLHGMMTSKIYLGKLRVEIEHDNEEQPLKSAPDGDEPVHCLLQRPEASAPSASV